MLDKLGGSKRAGLIFLAVSLFAAFLSSGWFIIAGSGGDKPAEPESHFRSSTSKFPVAWRIPGHRCRRGCGGRHRRGAASLCSGTGGHHRSPAAQVAALQSGAVLPAPGGGVGAVPAGEPAPAFRPAPEVPSTPDVVELVRQAVAEGRRDGEVSPVLQISPLYRDLSSRNPYLNEYETDYFVALGEHFWIYSKAWLALRNIVLLDVDSWTPELLAFDGESLNSILALVKERGIVPDSQGRELVYGYGEQIQEGFLRVEESVERLKSALVTVVQTDCGELFRQSQDR